MDRLELVRSLQNSVARLVLAASEEADETLREDMSGTARRLQTLLHALSRTNPGKASVTQARRTSARR